MRGNSKSLLALMALIFLGTTHANANQHVNGSYRTNGTYVAPYTRSSPDNTVTNNYSYYRNTNPYSGQTGTNQYKHDLTSPYYQGADKNGQIGHLNTTGGISKPHNH